jgi:uncharacterized membrane protein
LLLRAGVVPSRTAIGQEEIDMGKDVSEVIGTALGNAAREAIENVSKKARKRSNGALSGTKGLAAGAGLMALASVAGKGVSKGVSKLASSAGGDGDGALKGAGEKLKGGLEGAASMGRGDSGGSSEGVPGVGKGRRMPIQQDIDIGVPVKTAYNQWTQFEEWPKFMHRLQQVSQEDETHVSFKTKIWGVSKEFKAEIVEQRPDQRIKWRVTDGVTHTGVVTFHELGPRLTRVEVNLDLDPGSLIEKAARGMRYVKRAVRADLARFKAYVLMQEEETGAWRGRIEDGDVKRSSARNGSSSARSSSSGSRSRKSSSGSSRGSASSGGRRSSSSASRKSPSSSSRGSSAASAGRSSSSKSTAKRSSPKRSRGSSNGSGPSKSRARSNSARSRSGSH